MRYSQKRTKKSSKRAHLVFTPHFLKKIQGIQNATPPKTACGFGVFSRKKGVLFRKKGTACGYRTQYVVKISPDSVTGV